MDGSATYTTVQQLVVTVEYDDLYDLSLNATDSWNFINSFDVSGNGTGAFSAVLKSSNQAFKDILIAELPKAACTTQTSPKVPSSVGKNLVDAIYDEMENDLSLITNAVPDLLEDATHTNSVRWSAGADNLVTLLDASEVEVIAQQLPESNYAAYCDGSGANFEGVLPLKGNDTIIFVFNATITTVTRYDTKSPGAKGDSVGAGPAQSTTADAAITPPAVLGPYGSDAQAASYSSGARRIAFRIKVQNAAKSTAKLVAA
jgi:hypothetical protein